jgi:hypothetical protein
MNPLNPWQRIPTSWKCAECHKPARGYIDAPGLVVFACADHNNDLADLLMDALGYDMLGGSQRLRHPWKYWAGTRLYIARHTLWPPLRRKARAYRAEQERVHRVLSEAFKDDPTLLQRTQRNVIYLDEPGNLTKPYTGPGSDL